MRFAYMQLNGILAIVSAAPKSDLERVLGALTDKAYRDHVLSRSIPAEATDVRELPDDWRPPTSRALRNAWRHDGVDMPAAREIWRNHMRTARAPKLAELDVSYQRADEAGAELGKKMIASQKQALRDVTAHPDIESVTTPQELMSIWPDTLGEKPQWLDG